MSVCPSKTKRQGKTESRHTVAEVFRMHGASYRRTVSLSFEQAHAMDDIVLCRTSALGGRLYRCDVCGHEVNVYNSCNNRHCPTCQGFQQEAWSEARKAEMLPLTYFHNVFTLPHEFNALTLANKQVLYDLFFKAASETLLEFGREELKGTLGIIMLLQTWDQVLKTHNHLHCIIPCGALSFDRRRWNRPVSDKYLFDVKELSEAFKKRFGKLLRRARDKNELAFVGGVRELADAKAFETLVEQAEAKPWVVWSEPSMADPEHTIDYLSRYTHRVAISNSRIVGLTEDTVTITVIDRKTKKAKQVPLKPEEFIGRFLNHVLPKNYYRIRYYGLFANCNKDRLLRTALFALGQAPVIEKPDKKTARERILERTGRDIEQCPQCTRGRMEFIEVFEPALARHRWQMVLAYQQLARSPPKEPEPCGSIQ